MTFFNYKYSIEVIHTMSKEDKDYDDTSQSIQRIHYSLEVLNEEHLFRV